MSIMEAKKAVAPNEQTGIVATVYYRVQPGSREKVMQMAVEIRDYARSLEGNIEYCPMPSPYEANVMLSVEKWESVAAMQAYCASEECRAFQTKRAPYLVAESMEAHVYEVREIPLDVVMPGKEEV